MIWRRRGSVLRSRARRSVCGSTLSPLASHHSATSTVQAAASRHFRSTGDQASSSNTTTTKRLLHDYLIVAIACGAIQTARLRFHEFQITRRAVGIRTLDDEQSPRRQARSLPRPQCVASQQAACPRRGIGCVAVEATLVIEPVDNKPRFCPVCAS